jgi:hypothetical protein
MPTKRKVVKLDGSANWTEVGAAAGRVNRAILRAGEELAIDLECGAYRYSVLLRRDGDRFHGTWTCSAGDRTYTGSASGTLYASEYGYLFFGRWVEDGNDYHWWAELSPVTHFSDEVPA